ncbi:MAG: hypothetical protein IM624_01690 [Phenylobacterium sp.]|uniref:hypothetical protein n=1 Tax=Phenylobacterium sp. TaxID=1871053 RepID=UPI0025E50A7F|nr:hypothetical protein [Phenylobacterium sp.]MCA6297891.1 hypothetical protein [Phenylobacterium sp.]
MTAGRAPLEAGRFRALAEAYGGDISRWPEAERASAEAWLARNPREGAAELEAARALDDLLETWRTPEPAEALRNRVLIPAPAQVRQARRRAFVLTLGGGAGLAAACLAGILVAPVLLSTPTAGPAPSPSSQIEETAPSAALIPSDEVLAEVLADWEPPLADAEADIGV